MLSRALAIALVVLSASPLFAQAKQGGAAPYESDLQRLSEILGALHYLRDICGAREGQAWRNEMQALIDAEAPSGERRERLTASFNRGYRGRCCDQALPGRGLQDRARHHGALRELIVASATRPARRASIAVPSRRSASSPPSENISSPTATALSATA